MNTAGKTHRRTRLGRVTRVSIALLTVAAVAVPVAAEGKHDIGRRPHVIRLPVGWQPEGIATKGSTFYSGSLANGAVIRGSLKTGRRHILVEGVEGRAAVGLKVRDGLLWVAGGPNGNAFVYSARSGRELASFEFAPAGTSFINDVVVTERAAWFTDSLSPRLFKVPYRHRSFGDPQEVMVGGDFEQVPGFNLNGIDAVRGGRKLIVVQSVTGNLFLVNSRSGNARLIELEDGESVPNGDGILLDGGRDLWVVQNQLDTVTLVELDRDFKGGEVESRTTDRHFDVPTTVAESGDFLALPNARFDRVPDPTTAKYWITQIRKPD